MRTTGATPRERSGRAAGRVEPVPGALRVADTLIDTHLVDDVAHAAVTNTKRISNISFLNYLTRNFCSSIYKLIDSHHFF